MQVAVGVAALPLAVKQPCVAAHSTTRALYNAYNGNIVSGYPSDATENAVQADVVAAGYR